MKKLTGQFDFNKKLSWNPAYIKAPGTGNGMVFCQGCVHFGHDVEVNFSKANSHFYFCNAVLQKYGVAKGIKKETPSCSEFKARKSGVVPHTTIQKNIEPKTT